MAILNIKATDTSRNNAVALAAAQAQQKAIQSGATALSKLGDQVSERAFNQDIGAIIGNQEGTNIDVQAAIRNAGWGHGRNVDSAMSQQANLNRDAQVLSRPQIEAGTVADAAIVKYKQGATALADSKVADAVSKLKADTGYTDELYNQGIGGDPEALNAAVAKARGEKSTLGGYSGIGTDADELVRGFTSVAKRPPTTAEFAAMQTGNYTDNLTDILPFVNTAQLEDFKGKAGTAADIGKLFGTKANSLSKSHKAFELIKSNSKARLAEQFRIADEQGTLFKGKQRDLNRQRGVGQQVDYAQFNMDSLNSNLASAQAEYDQIIADGKSALTLAEKAAAAKKEKEKAAELEKVKAAKAAAEAQGVGSIDHAGLASAEADREYNVPSAEENLRNQLAVDQEQVLAGRNTGSVIPQRNLEPQVSVEESTFTNLIGDMDKFSGLQNDIASIRNEGGNANSVRANSREVGGENTRINKLQDSFINSRVKELMGQDTRLQELKLRGSGGTLSRTQRREINSEKNKIEDGYRSSVRAAVLKGKMDTPLNNSESNIGVLRDRSLYQGSNVDLSSLNFVKPEEQTTIPATSEQYTNAARRLNEGNPTGLDAFAAPFVNNGASPNTPSIAGINSDAGAGVVNRNQYPLHGLDPLQKAARNVTDDDMRKYAEQLNLPTEDRLKSAAYKQRAVSTQAESSSSPVSSYLNKAASGREEPISIGEENNNFGNIRATSETWEGSTGEKGGFVKFDRPEDGIRAVGRLLRNYNKDGVNTIEGIISRYAPEADNNDTGRYISNVAKIVGKKAKEQLNTEDMVKVMKGIFTQETVGGKNIKMGDIMKGWEASAVSLDDIF